MTARLATPRAARALGVAMLLLTAASVPLSVIGHQFTLKDVAGLPLLLLPFAAVGYLVARRQSANPIGWLLLLLALGMMLSTDAGLYAVAFYHFHHRGLPLPRLAVAMTQSWAVLVVLLPLPILLFPDGKVPSPRWRWPFRAYILYGVIFLGGIALTDLGAFTERHVKVDSSGELVSSGAKGGVFAAVGLSLYAAFVLSWVAAKLLDYRRSAGERRQQLKWLLSDGAVSFVSLMFTLASNGSFVFLGITALPISLGVGILKYRLYEIDRLISRTLSYTILTGLLAGIFIGTVVLATDVLPFSSPVGVAASTLAAAALFNPLRRRVQNLVDRRFNRARYDAQATIDTFTHRLRNAIDLDTVQTSLLDTVNHAVEPAHLTLWIRSAG